MSTSAAETAARMASPKSRDVHADEAITLAEVEARNHADGLGRYLGLVQAYKMCDEPDVGAEVFSLIRHSGLDPEAYLNMFFDSASEHYNRPSLPIGSRLRPPEGSSSL